MPKKIPPTHENAARTLRESAAAEHIGLSPYFLRAGRRGLNAAATLPFLRLGRAIVYDTRDLDAWLADRRVDPRKWVDRDR